MHLFRVLFFATLVFFLCLTIPLQALNSNISPLQQFYIMKEMVPHLKTVGIFWNKQTTQTEELLPQINRACAAVQVKAVIAEINELKAISENFRNMVNSYHIDAVWVIGNDEILNSDIAVDYLIKNSVLNKIPLFAPNTDWVNSGACVTLLNQDNRVKLFVNKKTADAIGVQLSETLLAKTEFLALN